MLDATQVALKDGRTAVIRPAKPDDAGPVIELVNAVGAEGIYIPSDRATRTTDEMRMEIAKADTVSALRLVAEVDGRMVAFNGYSRGTWSKNSHTGSLAIYIHKEFRSISVGQAVMRVGIDWARKVGIKKLTLGVFATNERAFNLYRKLGFAEEGRLKGEVIINGEPVDELLMTLWL